MSLKEMLEQSEKEYGEYVREQAELSRDGEADPEFIGMMTVASNFEDSYWDTIFRTRKAKPYRMMSVRGRYGKLTPMPTIKPKRKKKKLSEQEQDALLFEQGADWLEANKWTRGWKDSVTLPDGRIMEARCALGSILAAVPGFERSDGTPNLDGEQMLDRALGRIGMEQGEVITYNDNEAHNFRDVARYMRGVAYRIREGF